MPSLLFERPAIDDFCAFLSWETGSDVRVTGHPEDDPTDPLNVDATVEDEDSLGETIVDVLGDGPFDSGEWAGVIVVESDAESLAAQLAVGFGRKLRSKLTGQLARAKELGYLVMLLVDQVQDPDSGQGSVLLADVEDVRVVVENALSDHPGVADSVWFRDFRGNFSNLTYGSLPQVP